MYFCGLRKDIRRYLLINIRNNALMSILCSNCVLMNDGDGYRFREFQDVIPVKLRKKSGIKPGDKMAVITKHGVLQFIPVIPLKEAKGIISGLDTKDLRDESDKR